MSYFLPPVGHPCTLLRSPQPPEKGTKDFGLCVCFVEVLGLIKSVPLCWQHIFTWSWDSGCWGCILRLYSTLKISDELFILNSYKKYVVHCFLNLEMQNFVWQVSILEYMRWAGYPSHTLLFLIQSCFELYQITKKFEVSYFKSVFQISPYLWSLLLVVFGKLSVLSLRFASGSHYFSFFLDLELSRICTWPWCVLLTEMPQCWLAQ